LSGAEGKEKAKKGLGEGRRGMESSIQTTLLLYSAWREGNVLRALKWGKCPGFFEGGGIVRGKRPEMPGSPLFSTSV